jgi:cation transport ATPase
VIATIDGERAILRRRTMLLDLGIDAGAEDQGTATHVWVALSSTVMSQNVWLAFALSGVLIALAAAGILDPITGALSQSVAVLAVVANSARILKFQQ